MLYLTTSYPYSFIPLTVHIGEFKVESKAGRLGGH